MGGINQVKHPLYRWISLIAVVLATAACRPTLSPPRVDEVEPNWGYNGEDTHIEVIGAHFYPQVALDVRGKGAPEFAGEFSIRLFGPAELVAEYELEAVDLYDYEHLEGVVPAGLDPGTYDLEVVNPYGVSGFLSSAFTVSDTRADAIVVDPEGVVHQVNETAWIDLSVVDPLGVPVAANLEVNVIVVGDDANAGQAEATFVPASLQGQTPIEGGITGTLGPDGLARVGFSVGVPMTVIVSATASDGTAGVAGDDVQILWLAGSDLRVEFSLPGDPMSVVAGEPFVASARLFDQFGNPVDEVTETVLLKNACNGWVEAVDLAGATGFEVILEAATGTDACVVDFLQSATGPTGQSAEIEVVAAAVDSFKVQVVALGAKAGQDATLFLTPIDRFGNTAIWSSDIVSVADSVNGALTYNCTAGVTLLVCQAMLTRAGDDVVVIVEDGDGILGQSAPFVVAPGAATQVEVRGEPATVEAGTPFEVEAHLTDAFGNVVDPSGLLPGDFIGGGVNTDASCTWSSSNANNAFLRCQSTHAVESEQLFVQITSLGLDALSDAFEVVNAALDYVIFAPSSGTVVAGEILAVTVSAFDAFENPLIEQVNSNIDLDDETGTLSISSVTLGADGTASAAMSFTLVGDTVVTASQNGDFLGESGIILVEPSGTIELVVSPGDPWAWAQEPMAVRVESVDQFGNRTHFDDVVMLTTNTGAAPSTEIALTNGVGSGDLTWVSAVGGDRVNASSLGGTLIGQSELLFVATQCESGGPTPVVTFGGDSEAVACFDNGDGQADLVADMSGSVAGDAALAGYALAVRGGEFAASADPDLTVGVNSIGIFDLDALAVGANGCGAVVSSTAYVGHDDGQPVGPVSLTPVSNTIDITTGNTKVNIDDVRDCTRDFADGGTIMLRTTRGELTGVTPSGAGLSVQLGVTGDATFTLDASTVLTGGTASLVAWTPTGAIEGSASVGLQGDALRPVVWGWDPAGGVSGIIDQVTVTFSEPLLLSTVRTNNASVSGPSSALVSSFEPQGDGSEAVLFFDPPIDADLGLHTITLTDGMRDTAGNRLDGEYSGLASAWTGGVGGTSLVDPVQSCVQSVQLFKPDGDDGALREADQVAISFDSLSLPAWWVASVYEGSGALIRRSFLLPTATSGAWSWDGRDESGGIVDNGVYRIEIDAEDGIGNLGGPCVRSVTVDNRGN